MTKVTDEPDGNERIERLRFVRPFTKIRAFHAGSKRRLYEVLF
jgi:hypothetical protein